jgi:hypothetical protein
MIVILLKNVSSVNEAVFKLIAMGNFAIALYKNSMLISHNTCQNNQLGTLLYVTDL